MKIEFRSFPEEETKMRSESAERSKRELFEEFLYFMEQRKHKTEAAEEKIDYGDAVSAIMKSDDFGSTKDLCIQALKPDKEPSYYKAVIAIMKSDNFGSTKLHMIQNLK